MKGVGNGDYRWLVPARGRRDPDQRGDVMAGGEGQEMNLKRSHLCGLSVGAWVGPVR